MWFIIAGIAFIVALILLAKSKSREMNEQKQHYEETSEILKMLHLISKQ